jgi:hypothetical protein
MTTELVHDFPHPMIFEKKYPCISIYMPKHVHANEMKQDRLQFRHLIKECESALNIKYDEETTKGYLKNLTDLEEEDDFWLTPAQGLGFFADSQRCIVYPLQSSVEPLAIVADSFHIKPLIKTFQFTQKVQILGIDAENFALFEGNRYGIKPIKLADDAPVTQEAAIGIHKAESYLSRGSYGGANAGMYHGQGGRKDESERSIEKFFRFIDHYVLENYSKESKCPLILLALNEHHSVFRSVSDNPYLMKEGIKGDFESFDLKELSGKVNTLLEPLNIQKLQDKLDRYQAALSLSKGSDKIAEITKAALEGRIETLLIEENRIVKGQINPRNQQVDFKDPQTTLMDDVLDDLAQLVLKNRGEVYLIPKTIFESKYGIGAIYRY